MPNITFISKRNPFPGVPRFPHSARITTIHTFTNARNMHTHTDIMGAHTQRWMYKNYMYPCTLCTFNTIYNSHIHTCLYKTLHTHTYMHRNTYIHRKHKQTDTDRHTETRQIPGDTSRVSRPESFWVMNATHHRCSEIERQAWQGLYCGKPDRHIQQTDIKATSKANVQEHRLSLKQTGRKTDIDLQGQQTAAKKGVQANRHT